MREDRFTWGAESIWLPLQIVARRDDQLIMIATDDIGTSNPRASIYDVRAKTTIDDGTLSKMRKQVEPTQEFDPPLPLATFLQIQGETI